MSAEDRTPDRSPRPQGPGEPETPADDPAGIPDGVWEEFQRAAAAGVRDGSAPKEPSARARMVTARLRASDEEAVRHRGAGGPRGRAERSWSRQPPGWRTGPVRRNTSTGRGVRRPLRRVSAVLLLLALVGWTVKVTLIDGRGVQEVAAPVREWLGAGSTPDAAEMLPPETAPPTEAPAAEPALAGPSLDDPYRGSPARKWADGADAIEPPEAVATGGVTAEDIAEGARLTKKFLVAANLAPEVLAGGEPEAALALIDPGQRELADAHREALDGPTAEADATHLFTRFDPTEVRLVDVPVKVRGHMEVTRGEGDGEAVIRADYTFVYPVTRADDSGEVTRTVVRRVMDVLVVPPDPAVTTPGHIWLLDFGMEFGNAECVSADGLLHPWFAEGRPAPEATGATRDPYDRSRSLDDTSQECGRVSRI